MPDHTEAASLDHEKLAPELAGSADRQIIVLGLVVAVLMLGGSTVWNGARDLLGGASLPAKQVAQRTTTAATEASPTDRLASTPIVMERTSPYTAVGGPPPSPAGAGSTALRTPTAEPDGPLIMVTPPPYTTPRS